MIGPQETSLLHKLGLKVAYEMSDDELQGIVAKDQHRRTVERAMGRLQRNLSEADDEGTYTPKKVGRPRTKSRVKKELPPQTLEGFGIASALCLKLRATGKPDWQIILELQGAGII
jgi:hypothetical protein